MSEASTSAKKRKLEEDAVTEEKKAWTGPFAVMLVYIKGNNDYGALRAEEYGVGASYSQGTGG
jgi:hypothetical protein